MTICQMIHTRGTIGAAAVNTWAAPTSQTLVSGAAVASSTASLPDALARDASRPNTGVLPRGAVWVVISATCRPFVRTCRSDRGKKFRPLAAVICLPTPWFVGTTRPVFRELTRFSETGAEALLALIRRHIKVSGTRRGLFGYGVHAVVDLVSR